MCKKYYKKINETRLMGFKSQISHYFPSSENSHRRESILITHEREREREREREMTLRLIISLNFIVQSKVKKMYKVKVN
jgi:hypothetical protein